MQKNKLTIMVLVICALISITLGVLLYIDNSEKPSPESNQVDNTDTEEISFDYEGLEDELVKLIEKDENTKAYISTCKDNGVDENNNPNLDIDNKELSIDSVMEVVNKLKQANKVEKTTSARTCPAYIYLITTDIDGENRKDHFLLDYGEDKTSLLVGYKDEGYAFYYNSSDELKGFLENLK